jgi:membrane protease YdiL (CAAX protease family)
LIAYAVFLFVGQVIIMLTLPIFMHGLSSEQVDALWKQEHRQGAAVILATPAAIAVLWVAIRRAGREFADYLALNWPRPRELVIALGLTAALFVLEMILNYLVVGVQEPRTNPYVVAGGAGGLLLMLVSGCIAAPILEELIVRGFVFRGWSQTYLGSLGAIVLTSALWSISRTQYDWLGQLNIFFAGLAFGYFRWRYNSTWLPMIVHSAFNTAIFFLTGPYA